MLANYASYITRKEPHKDSSSLTLNFLTVGFSVHSNEGKRNIIQNIILYLGIANNSGRDFCDFQPYMEPATFGFARNIS